MWTVLADTLRTSTNESGHLDSLGPAFPPSEKRLRQGRNRIIMFIVQNLPCFPEIGQTRLPVSVRAQGLKR